MGCFRTIEEIMQWGGADDSSRELILRQAELRKHRRMLDMSPPSGAKP